MTCPLGCKNPDCNTCPFSKEGLCDYPFTKVYGNFQAQVTAPRWKFWFVNLFGKTIHKEAGMTFKRWRNKLWVFGNKKCEVKK